MEIGNVAETFRNGTVLVTGGTGFLGKILTEKLLRSCSVKNIAILARGKKGLAAKQRVDEIYKQDLFDRLRNEKPDFMNHIKVIDGNLEESSMGLLPIDRDWIVENVNLIFHCAATIKFNEPIEVATKINVQGTENLLELAAQMKNLKGFVHVSTAYSHCPRKEIREEYYPVHITAKELKNIRDLDESATAGVLGNWPNTYTLTKAVTENMISTKYAKTLPISIFRPSIICCTQSEPEPGWLENMNGPTGIATGFMVGFLRTVPNVGQNVTDIIPADYTVNALISVMWDTVNRYQNSDLINKEPKIFNYISCVESPLTWSRYISEMHTHYNKAPPLQSMWYGFYVFYTNLWFGMILRFLLHRIPAFFMDLALLISGKRPKMLRMYGKTEHMIDLLYEFSTRQWTFDNSNTRELWLSLSKEDRNTFCYSLEKYDWKPYLKSYYYGIRKHILHEDPNNTEKALKKNRRLFWLNQLSICLVIYLVLQLSWMLLKYLL